MRACGVRVRTIGVSVQEVDMVAGRLSGETARLAGQPRGFAAACCGSLPQERGALANGRQV